MTSDPQELGKGIFGYRKSAVNQLLADRDIMLRQAEGRVRAAESKVAELEGELTSIRERNSRMDEQLERLRSQLDSLASRKDDAPAGSAGWAQDGDSSWEPSPEWEEPSEPSAPSTETTPGPVDPESEAGFAESEAAFAGLDGIPEGAVESAAPESIEGLDTIFPPADHEDPASHIGDIGERDHATRPSWLEPEPEHSEAEDIPEFRLEQDGYAFEPIEAEDPAAETFVFPFEDDEYAHVDQPADEATVPWMAASESTAPSEPLAATQVPESAEAPVPSEPRTEDRQPVSAAPDSGVSSEAIDLTNRFLTDEIQGILTAAEESAARIVERARATTQHQIAQSNRLWREVQAEVSRFAAWREQVEPVIREVQVKVEGVRAQIEAIPERIRDALAPMADSISGIDADLAELASATSPPLLLTPTGLDDESGAPSGWADESDADRMDTGSQMTEGDDAPGHLAG